MVLTSDQIDGVAVVGDVLGPLFLFAPYEENGKRAFDELASLDAEQCAGDWPFLPVDEAKELLGRLSSAAAEDSRESAGEEYRRLFVGPFALPCPPWGSVYTDRDCVMFGESTLSLRAWMRGNGIAPTASNSEPDDHIGRMLLLASWVSKEIPASLEEYLSFHLLTWAPHYLAQLEEASKHPFYRTLARLTSSTLDAMRRDCSLDVTEPHFYR